MSLSIETIRKVRQVRAFTDDPVSEAQLTQLLEVARWTGSSRNTQPWHFIVVRNKALLDQLSQVRGEAIRWVRSAPLAIVLVISAEGEISGAFDEGRLTERLMIAAHALGLGAGTTWFGDAGQQATAKTLLGIPDELTARSMVAIGRPDRSKSKRSGSGGRLPLDELVSYERMR